MEIKDIKILGTLPDPFLKPDGSRVKSADEWQAHKKELYKTAVELQYGTMPPPPEFLEVEKLCDSTYIIITGRRQKPVRFTMRLLRPTKDKKLIPGKFPVVIDGDLCFDYAFKDGWVDTFLSNNITLALFNRVELAHDIRGEGRGRGQLYDTYPEYSFGALGAWAWGYSRVIDALEILDIADLSCITATGHSRGGKTAMLAGALDERITITNPNETCAGACSCYRLHLDAINSRGEQKRSETLKDLWDRFGFWMGEGMEKYTECEQELPFDSHFLKALVAPRTLFVSEALDDIWANPVGSLVTTKAAGEVFKFLGVPDNLFWYFRDGYHFHDLQDIKMLVSLIKHKYEGAPLCDGFFKAPFTPPKMYDWQAPMNN